jgi:hypothetical protein
MRTEGLKRNNFVDGDFFNCILKLNQEKNVKLSKPLKVFERKKIQVVRPKIM